MQKNTVLAQPKGQWSKVGTTTNRLQAHITRRSFWSADRSLYSEFNYAGREIEIERSSHSKLTNETKKMVHFNYISVDRYNLIVENQANRWCFCFVFFPLSECISISSCVSVFVCADFPFRQTLRCRFRFTTMCSFSFACTFKQIGEMLRLR